MGLQKLKILVEKEDAVFVFEQSSAITALFNPDKLVFNKTVNWRRQGAAHRDVTEQQFANAESQSLSLDLIFDTYDNSDVYKSDVRGYTDKLLKLTAVNAEKHRPPVCLLFWGLGGVFFQGILKQLRRQFTLFMEDGTPVRATLQCTFKEWTRNNEEDLRRQNLRSSDIAKTRIIKRGETLSNVAAEEYRDPGLWRPIAHENNIDDPLSLVPGTVLLIPTLTRQNLDGRQ
jgi:nucleoid-associated protein YgaU